MFYGQNYGNQFISDSLEKADESNEKVLELENNLSSSSSCKLNAFNTKEIKARSIYFMDASWRDKLCRCMQCIVIFYIDYILYSRLNL